MTFLEAYSKLGEKLRMWLTSLKIAIVEKNTDKINELLDDLPQLEDKAEIEQAIYLLREASELIYTLKDETSVGMRQIKKNINFLKSTHVQAPNKLDIKS